MGTYTNDAKSAAADIRKAGGKIVITRKTVAGEDPVTQASGSEKTRKWNTYGLGLPPTKTKDFAPGTLLLRDIIEVWVGGWQAPFTPGPGDTILINKLLRTILNNYELNPDGTQPIIWKFYAEAGGGDGARVKP